MALESYPSNLSFGVGMSTIPLSSICPYLELTLHTFLVYILEQHPQPDTVYNGAKSKQQIPFLDVLVKILDIRLSTNVHPQEHLH